MASQADIAAALQSAGVTVYGLQVNGNQVSGTVASEDARSKAYSAIAGVDNSANLNIGVNAGFASQEANAAAAGTRTYTVQAGDSLGKIAQHHYGAASQWKKIYEANRDKISDPDVVRVGTELVIPS